MIAPARDTHTPSLAAGTASRLHRIHLTSGKVLEGGIERPSRSRLADHLLLQRGFIAVLSARNAANAAVIGDTAVHLDKVLFIVECEPEEEAVQHTPALVGSKVPMPHRIHLDGCTLEGDLHRSPATRLTDHLASLKGFVSLTRASDADTGERFGYAVFNMSHLLHVEAVAPGDAPAEP